jgi:hypothetical protein
MRTARLSLLAATIVASAFAVPATASAQQTLPAEVVRAQGKAEALTARATALIADHFSKHTARRAARMHAEAAALYAAGSVQRFDCLYAAATLHYSGGELQEARAKVEQAAEQAMERGDVLRASRAWSDAATLAVAMRDTDAAATMTRRAEMLATSPLLSEAQRGELQQVLVARRQPADALTLP